MLPPLVPQVKNHWNATLRRKALGRGSEGGARPLSLLKHYMQGLARGGAASPRKFGAAAKRARERGRGQAGARRQQQRREEQEQEESESEEEEGEEEEAARLPPRRALSERARAAQPSIAARRAWGAEGGAAAAAGSLTTESELAGSSSDEGGEQASRPLPLHTLQARGVAAWLLGEAVRPGGVDAAVQPLQVPGVPQAVFSMDPAPQGDPGGAAAAAAALPAGAGSQQPQQLLRGCVGAGAAPSTLPGPPSCPPILPLALGLADGTAGLLLPSELWGGLALPFSPVAWLPQAGGGTAALGSAGAAHLPAAGAAGAAGAEAAAPAVSAEEAEAVAAAAEAIGEAEAVQLSQEEGRLGTAGKPCPRPQQILGLSPALPLVRVQGLGVPAGRRARPCLIGIARGLDACRQHSQASDAPHA